MQPGICRSVYGPSFHSANEFFRPVDMLIIEQEEIIAEVLVDALSAEGIDAAVVGDDRKAIETCESDAPCVLITRINRRKEDLGGLRLARGMRRKRPLLGVIYMAAVWPAYLHRCALEFRERFLINPFRSTGWSVPSVSCSRHDGLSIS